MGVIQNAASNLGRQMQAAASALGSGIGSIGSVVSDKVEKDQRAKERKEKADSFKASAEEKQAQRAERREQAFAEKKEMAKFNAQLRQDAKKAEIREKGRQERITLSKKDQIRRQYQQGKLAKELKQNASMAQAMGFNTQQDFTTLPLSSKNMDNLSQLSPDDQEKFGLDNEGILGMIKNFAASREDLNDPDEVVDLPLVKEKNEDKSAVDKNDDGLLSSDELDNSSGDNKLSREEFEKTVTDLEKEYKEKLKAYEERKKLFNKQFDKRVKKAEVEDGE